MKIVFLGTSGSMPTPERGSASLAIKIGGEIILFDCGEGTQQRMVAARVGFRRPMHILITHLHGDHILGLPGLLQTMSLLRRERSIDIYGPKGIVDFLTCVSRTLGGPNFPVQIHELNKPETIYSGARYHLRAVEAEHHMEAWSYALIERERPGRFHPEKARALGVPEGYLWGKLQRGEDVRLPSGEIIRSSQIVDPPRPGRKIVYSGDTRPNESLIELANDSDILVHEATFDDSLMERANEDGHSTAGQAAEVAKKAEVEKLVLTHISSRYPDPSILLEQAMEIFPRTLIAEDLMELEIPLKD
jgi:ribonuclease Z